MIKNHRKPKGKEIPCASQEIGKKLTQPKTAQNIFMIQLQEQKRHLKLSLQVFSEAPTILMSRNDEMIQSCKINYMPTGDIQGLDGEMLPQWSSSPHIPNKDNFARTTSLLLQFFQISVLLLVMMCLIVKKKCKDNTYIRYHCDKCMCYKKWQCLRGSVFKTILHEGKAIFSTKQTNIAKQVQWYFYILEKLKNKKGEEYKQSMLDPFIYTGNTK